MTDIALLVLVRQKGLPVITVLGDGDVLNAGTSNEAICRERCA